MKVTQKSYGTAIDILFNLDDYAARPIMVSDTGIVAVDGKKIVKAGSLLNVDGEVANDNTVRYVLLKDVDVTYGDAAGAGVYRGTLNEAKIETNTGVTVSADAKTALKGIFFMSDADMDYNAGYGDNDSEALATRVGALETTIDTDNTGLVAVVAALDTTVSTLDTTVNADNTGLVDRVEALEAAVDTGN